MDYLSVNAKDDERPISLCADTPLVCLNFKVPLRVRQQFKIRAAHHNMTMTDLLLQLLDADLSTTANGTVVRAFTKRSRRIKK